MNAVNDQGDRSSGARPVILLRARPGVAPETARVVHVVRLPSGGNGLVSALCGVLLCPEECETVIPGHGMPCDQCLISHAQHSDPSPTGPDSMESPLPVSSPEDPSSPGVRPGVAVLGYQAWGWPVTLRGEQVWLSLGGEVVALLMPVLLAATVTATLVRRHCPPALLAQPGTPEHRVLLCGEPYGIDLPWPAGMHRITGTVLLPPTATPRGLPGWVQPPGPDTLRNCREIDVVAAVLATGRDSQSLKRSVPQR